MAKKTMDLWTLLAILAIPGSVFWILYRFGFLSIIDALAVGVLAAAALLLGARWFLTKRVISFKR